MHDGATLAALEVFVLLLGVLVVVAVVSRRVALPYSLALVVFGVAVSALAPPLGVQVTPGLVLAVLLPGLVFEAAFQMDLRDLRTTLPGMAFLAGPGVLVVAGLVALTLHLAAGMRPESAFLVGAMVSATDPAAVVATVRRLRAPRRLATLVEGESLFNDGTGIVLFSIAVAGLSVPVSPAEGLLRFVLVVVASVLVGLLAGVLASWLARLVEDHLIELAITIVAAYGGYLVADRLGQSGLIASVVAGLVLGTYGRRVGLTPASHREIDVIWAALAFVLTALAFLLVGLAVRPAQLLSAALPIAWGVAAVLVARAILVYGLLRGLLAVVARRRPELDVPGPWRHVLFWSGLRGAVAVALALSLPAGLPDRELLQGVTFGIVLFTLLVHGSTAGLVVRRSGVGVGQQTAAQAP